MWRPSLSTDQSNEPAIEFIRVLFSSHVKVQTNVCVQTKAEVIVHDEHFSFIFASWAFR